LGAEEETARKDHALVLVRARARPRRMVGGASWCWW
jgi:hypothetical protein